MRLKPRAFLAIHLSLFLLSSAVPKPVHASSDTVVLVLAQNGDKVWKNTVKLVVKQAKLPYPIQIFFGSGDTALQQAELQDIVESFESSGAHTIYVVPFVVSSYSEVVRQWKYLLGDDVQPGFMNTPLFPVRHSSAVRFLEPFNDSAVVVEILLDRIHDISTKPEQESVIIVSRGARDHSDNDNWLRILQSLSARIQERGGYKTVEAVTLRDEGPPETRQKALEYLRKRVKATEASNTRAIVVNLLLTSGGMEHRIGLELRGLTYAYNTKALLPDPRISEWVRSQVP